MAAVVPAGPAAFAALQPVLLQSVAAAATLSYEQLVLAIESKRMRPDWKAIRRRQRLARALCEAI